MIGSLRSMCAPASGWAAARTSRAPPDRDPSLWRWATPRCSGIVAPSAAGARGGSGCPACGRRWRGGPRPSSASRRAPGRCHGWCVPPAARSATRRSLGVSDSTPLSASRRGRAPGGVAAPSGRARPGPSAPQRLGELERAAQRLARLRGPPRAAAARRRARRAPCACSSRAVDPSSTFDGLPQPSSPSSRSQRAEHPQRRARAPRARPERARDARAPPRRARSPRRGGPGGRAPRPSASATRARAGFGHRRAVARRARRPRRPPPSPGPRRSAAAGARRRATSPSCSAAGRRSPICSSRRAAPSEVAALEQHARPGRQWRVAIARPAWPQRSSSVLRRRAATPPRRPGRRGAAGRSRARVRRPSAENSEPRRCASRQRLPPGLDRLRAVGHDERDDGRERRSAPGRPRQQLGRPRARPAPARRSRSAVPSLPTACPAPPSRRACARPGRRPRAAARCARRRDSGRRRRAPKYTVIELERLEPPAQVGELVRQLRGRPPHDRGGLLGVPSEHQRAAEHAGRRARAPAGRRARRRRSRRCSAAAGPFVSASAAPSSSSSSARRPAGGGSSSARRR